MSELEREVRWHANLTNLFEDIISRLEILEAENSDLRSYVENVEGYNDDLKRRIKSLEKFEDDKYSDQRVETLKKPKIKAPLFSGEDGARPIKFLHDLENYLKAINATNEDCMIYIQSTLTKTAAKWFYVHRENFQDFDTFVVHFEARFWSEPIQRKFRNKLEIGHFYQKRDKTRMAYITEILDIAKELGMDQNIPKLIRELSHHFDHGIARTVRLQHIESMNDFYDLLEDYDQMDQEKIKYLQRENQPENTNKPQYSHNADKNKENRFQEKKSENNFATKPNQKNNNLQQRKNYTNMITVEKRKKRKKPLVKKQDKEELPLVNEDELNLTSGNEE